MKTTPAALLKNGTTLIETRIVRDGAIVLADCGAARYHRYATWWMDTEGHTHHGHYFHTIVEAAEDFAERR